jgi:hypothetical protein
MVREKYGKPTSFYEGDADVVMLSPGIKPEITVVRGECLATTPPMLPWCRYSTATNL